IAQHRSAANPRPFTLVASRRTVTRRIRFDHGQHNAIACTQCHTNSLTRAPEGGDCAGCHAQHHRPEADCTACHASANALATHTLQDHKSCASANCHAQRAASLPTSREACLVCHSAQQAHQPGKLCDQCHQVRA